MSTLLEVSDLHAGYGKVEVLHGIDLTVEEGAVAVVLGANGAGKTTTLRAITGMVRPRGTVRLGGVELGRRRTVDIAAAGVAHVPQGRGTFAHLTVEDNLRAGAYRRRARGIASDIKQWYGTFPVLYDRRGQRAGQLSGGEQQMLAVARAFMSRPRLLLLDEPSLGLSPQITRHLFVTLKEINDELGTAMLIVEQDAALALSMASYGFVLENGVITAADTAHALRSDDRVRRAYLGR